MRTGNKVFFDSHPEIIDVCLEKQTFCVSIEFCTKLWKQRPTDMRSLYFCFFWSTDSDIFDTKVRNWFSVMCGIVIGLFEFMERFVLKVISKRKFYGNTGQRGNKWNKTFTGPHTSFSSCTKIGFPKTRIFSLQKIIHQIELSQICI